MHQSVIIQGRGLQKQNNPQVGLTTRPLALMTQFQIQITDRHPQTVIEHPRLEQVVRRVLFEEGIDRASISVALVNDAQIHDVNRQFLGHDYPTDVISFLLNADDSDAFGCGELPQVSMGFDFESDSVECEGRFIEGEIVVSTETALREAIAHGWSPQAELLLYVVHGLLHLCGYDDLTDDARPAMRTRERELLGLWGFCPTGLES